MTTLQASLIFKPLPLLSHFSSSSSKHVLATLSFSNPTTPYLRLTTTTPFKTRFCHHKLLLHCTLNPENVNSLSNNDNSIQEIQPQESNSIDSNGGVVSHVESEVIVENEELKKKLPIVVFLMGLYAKVKKGFENILLSDWFSWWPFWQQEKRLERLIAEADANPKDAALQSALLAELNKQSPESVIRRFEQRAHAVDSRGVAEYMRALVTTNAIADYLPDEQSGKPSSLPSLIIPISLSSFHLHNKCFYFLEWRKSF